MSIELVIDRLGDAVAIAVLESGELVDLLTAETGPEAIEDRLFLARITGIEPAIDGAFLDHGGKQPGFITGKDARHRRGLAKRVSIKHCLEDGEWLVVQGLRGPEGGKGARFTTDLRLAGASLVYRPHGRDVTARGSLRSPGLYDRVVGRMAWRLLRWGMHLRRSVERRGPIDFEGLKK